MQTEQKKKRFTTIILANGSADALQKTLESTPDWAQETLVLATAQMPDREQLHLPNGVRLIESSALDHRGKLRNAALAEANGDWVFWLEAGEVLEGEVQATLADFVRDAADEKFVYWVFVALPIEHGNVAGEQCAQVRLHPRHSDLRFSGRVRETLLPAAAKCGLQVEGLSLVIQHTAEISPAFESRTAAQHEKQLAEQALADGESTAELWNCLGESSQQLGEWAHSEGYYQRALLLAEAKSPAALEAYYGLLATLDARGPDRQQQLRLCMEAIEQFPLDAQLLCALGGYLQSLGHVELAVRSYGVAMQHGRIEPTVVHLSNILELAAASRADVFLQAEQWRQAEGAVTEGLELFPNSQRLLRQQLQLDVRRGDEHAALATGLRMEVAPLFRDTVTTAIHGALAATEGNWVIARAQLESAWRAGWRDPLCCQWLAEVQLSQQDLEPARTTLDAWQQLHPRSPELRRMREQWQRLSSRPCEPIDHDFEFEPGVVADAVMNDGHAAGSSASVAAKAKSPNPAMLRLDPAASKTVPPLAPLAQKMADARSATNKG